MHIVWDEDVPGQIRRGTTKGSHLWVRRQYHDDIGDAINQLHQNDMQVLVTHLSDDAVDFREIDYTKPTAIILGQEKHGATDKAVTMSDKRITIPMQGMVQSLNVSVAGALILYEAQRQRQLAGLYEKPRLPESEIQRLLFERGYTRLYKHCKKKGLPYPQIGPEGEVIADERWWQQMQLTPEALAKLEDGDEVDDLESVD